MSSVNERDYKEISQKFKDLLELETNPVAIKLFSSKQKAGEILEKYDGKIRHCEMVYEASGGKSFYATLDEELCQGGASALGLRDFPKALLTGDKYYSLGRFASAGSARHELTQVPKIDTFMEAVGYAPLENANFDPDVIVMYLTPVQAMKISQANGYLLGSRFKASFAGIQSLCSDVVANPYITKEPNISLGCSGSRKFTGFRPDQVVVGLPAENIDSLVNSLEQLLS